MKILLLALACTVLCFSLEQCTSDRNTVVNPDSLNTVQSAIVNEKFDASIDLPSGWVTSSNSWVVDSAIGSNNSTGYTNCSGKNNIEIANDVALTFDDTLTTGSYSTTGYTNITVIYGSRNSKHFTDNGSSIKAFQYSVDNGATWIAIPYKENTNDSFWYLINGGARLSLSSASNKASLRFRWLVHREATPSGTYRIDDFQVYGTKS